MGFWVAFFEIKWSRTVFGSRIHKSEIVLVKVFDASLEHLPASADEESMK